MSKKYYGVKKGRKKGIYISWDECKTHIDGYPNAQYKSFGNYDDAFFFVWGKHSNNTEELQDD